MESMRILACRHFRLFNLPTYVTCLDGVWNTWVETYNHDGILYQATYVPSFFPKYLEHLLRLSECREEIGISLETVKELFEAVNGGLNKACIG